MAYLRPVFALIACKEASLFGVDSCSGTSVPTFYKLLEIERYDLVGVTAGAKHRHEYHVALLLKKASAWHGAWESAHLKHDRHIEWCGPCLPPARSRPSQNPAFTGRIRTTTKEVAPHQIVVR